MSLKKLHLRLNKIAKGVPVNTSRAIKTLALAIDQQVVLRTPVDTGRAKSNWIVSVGAPNEYTIDPISPGTRGSTSALNTRGALQQAETTLASYQAGDIYITNNLDYIGALNAGSSRQAAPMFIEASIQSGVVVLRTARIIE